jgi:IPT/TIG domain
MATLLLAMATTMLSPQLAKASNPPDTLTAGTELTSGQSITTPGGAYRLTMQGDGNLVEYNASGAVLWASGTSGNSGDYLTMQGDGNLVLYNSSASALWASGTNGNPGASLVLGDDGNLVVDSASGTPLWAPTGLLVPGGELSLGQSITTPGETYRLTMQGDGNMVEYDAAGTVLWATGTGGDSSDYLTMQGDGNLVLYSATGSALWATGTNGNPGSYLVLGDDGNLVVDSATGSPLWAPTGLLVPGAELTGGQSITSPGGTYRLTMQGDGNLVEYNASGAVLWASGTSGSSGDYLTMQGDGNLVLYNSSASALWASGTSGNPGAYLVLGDDGSLVVDSVTGTALWTAPPSSTPPAPYSIPSPVSGGWQLNGSAQLNAGVSPANLELTPAVNWQAGSAFWPVPVPGVGATVSFDELIGSGSGADGLTLTLADASDTSPTALGVNGGGEGFSGIDGIAVSMDTWQNAVNPSDNFVGIATGGVPGAGQELNYVQTNTSVPALRNTVHHFVVTTSSTGITVTMDGAQVLDYATSLPPYVLVGFTGGTGGFNDVHQVQNVVITTGPPAQEPTVAAISPNTGSTAGGTSVTITGTNFSGASSVDFGTTAATFTVNSSTSITATAPTGTGTGTVDVTVTAPGGTSATSTADQFTYTPPPAPTVTAVSPTSGQSTGTTSVTITGTTFTGATAVDFGANAAAFTVNSATSITATAPAGTVGTVDVTVTTPGGTSATNAADQYTYTVPPAPTVTGLSPSSGQSTGSTSVMITGTGFAGATAVNFGTTAATFTVDSSTTIAATAPPGTLGSVDITVTTPGGTSTTDANDKYTYTQPPVPTVSAVSPTSGVSTGTAVVTITGTGFIGATAVTFGTTAATFSVSNSTTISATAPAGTGTVNVTVTTPGGTSASGAADQYTYIPPPAPTITGVSPSSGPSGTLVTITGTSFTGATTVDFGAGNPATTFATNNDTTVTAIAPSGTGTVDVTVTTPGGTSATSAADQFTYTTGTSPYLVASPTAGSWQLNGSAQLNSTGSPPNLELTPATSYEAGSAFDPVPVGAVGVTASFDAFIGGGSGADGLTFTMADAGSTQPTALGVNGGGEGFSGINGTAVSLDTWQNSVNPSDNFVGIADGPIPGAANELNYVATNTTIPVLQNATHHFVVTTTSAGITVDMDGTQVLSYADTDLPPYLLLGFTGGTGGFDDIHQVQNVIITATGYPPPAPTVTGVSPDVGPSAGDSSVTITGTNLSGVTEINFGPDNPVETYALTSPTTIVATTPNGTGTVDVTVTTPGGTSAVNPGDQFTFVSGPPVITDVSPNSGPVTGGTTVTITGTGFGDATSVVFGTANVATQWTIVNFTTIVATAPVGQLGPYDIQVTNPAGTSTPVAADVYTYTTPPVPTVTGVSPDTGPSTGGTTVTITGVGLTGAANVDFGPGNPSAVYTVNSDTSITATAPAGTLGSTVDVTVTTAGGTSATGAADHYTYTAPEVPTVTGVSPGSGTNGTPVTITGTNFTGATAVNFGTAAATFTVSTSTTMYVTAPNGTLGTTVDVTVTTAGGTSATSAADQYTYTAPPAPTVTGLSQNSGFATYSVVVTGTNLTGASAVDFGSTDATFTVNGATSITATVPTGTGTVDVTVVTPGGTSATSAADQFTYSTGTPPPTMVATYRGDLGRSGYYPSQTGVTTANAATLKPLWTDSAGSVGSYSQPTVANNMLYWGDWNGYEHGTTLSGTDVWSTYLGIFPNGCNPSQAGPSGAATAAMMGTTPVVYVPGGADTFYALNALTGAIIWQTNLGSISAGDMLWDSPLLYNGNVYIGISSFGDCPLVQGQLVEMNANTGAIEHVADMVPDGCIGGGIWSSPALDTSNGTIYVTTATPNGCGTPELSPAIVQLSASTLTILSSWTVPPSELFDDPDFGSTPTLFTATIDGQLEQMVGAVNKNGLFYAWNRNDLSAGPVWQTRIADPAGGPLSIVSASWDGTTLYTGGGNTIINGTSCYENISALNPATGAFVWRDCIQGSMTSGITEVPGLLIMGYGATGEVDFINAKNGNLVSQYSPAAAVEGETTVWNGVVYVPLGNGTLLALGQ